jgi:hypothetical protein
MRLRHLVAAANVSPDGEIVDPARVRHGLIVGQRVSALAGEVDPATHLNLDFAEHRLEDAVVVEELVVGAAVLVDGDGFAVAWPSRAALSSLGPVDVGARRLAWQRAATQANPAVP